MQFLKVYVFLYIFVIMSFVILIVFILLCKTKISNKWLKRVLLKIRLVFSYGIDQRSVMMTDTLSPNSPESPSPGCDFNLGEIQQ